MTVKLPYCFTGPILNPLYSLYANLSHRRVRSSMYGAVELTVPVVSVGNISFGGTAKTPLAEYIARKSKHHGFKPGVVLRGYKGRLERESAPPEVVSDGEKLRLEWELSGDEARLLAENLLPDKIPVAVGRDRVGASELLVRGCDVDIIVLDDGFQFTSLKRDFDLALVDSLAPFGRADGGHGPLREPAWALGRADAILLTRTEAVSSGRLGEIIDHLRSSVRNLPPIFKVRTLVKSVRSVNNEYPDLTTALAGKKVVAFAGIGNPMSFEHTLHTLDCEIADMIAFPDHHAYRQRDIQRVNKCALDHGADIIVTTSKDAVRLNGNCDCPGISIAIVDIGVEIERENELINLVAAKMELPENKPK